MSEFTAQHGLALLALLTALDHRHGGGDQASVMGKAETWAKLLSGADPQWVRSFVERAHMEPRPYPLSVGDIKRAWDNHRRVEAARERPEPALFGSKRAPEGFAALVEASAVRWRVARQAAGGSELWRQQREEAQRADAGVSVPWDVVRVQDSRERRCVNHDICVCTHDKACRGGWLEGSGSARRCPVCEEAVVMRGEPAVRKGRRR